MCLSLIEESFTNVYGSEWSWTTKQQQNNKIRLKLERENYVNWKFLLAPKVSPFKKIEDMDLWSSFGVKQSVRSNNDKNQNRKFCLDLELSEREKKGQDDVESNNGEIFFEELLQARRENVNEYLWLGVIGSERYASDEIFLLLLHFSMPDYCHESWNSRSLSSDIRKNVSSH